MAQHVPTAPARDPSSAAKLVNLRAQMERSTSIDIRQEGNDLRQAAEQSPNVILDLTLDGLVRWVSPTWPNLVGTEIDSIQGKPIADLLVDNNSVFADAIDALQKNDSGSKVIRFSVLLGPLSTLAVGQDDAATPTDEHMTPEEDQSSPVLDLEAQGILVYDRATGVASHVRFPPPYQ